MKTAAQILRRVSLFHRAHVLLAMALVVISASSATAAPFRQIPGLPQIPPSITLPSEREILKTDRNRLAARRTELRKLQTDYDRNCSERVSTASTLHRHCSFRLQEIHRQSSRLRRDIGALRVRFRTVEENALRRRHRAAGRPTVPRPRHGDDVRLAIVNETLARAGDDWHSILKQSRTAASRAAGNPALRDAAAYLQGVYEGDIAADVLDNPYYKHGVRRWLVGDSWSAALSFARAARDNPGDDRVFVSFAAAAARQHSSPACARARRCVSGNIADWAGRFDRSHKQAVTKLLFRYRREHDVSSMTPIHNLLGAITIYAASTVPNGKMTGSAADSARDIMAKLRRADLAGALEGYIRVWQSMSPRRAHLFSGRYMNVLGERNFRRFFDRNPAVLTATMKADGQYLAKLRRALRDSPDGNPFAGALTRAQIIRLQR